MTAVSLPQIRPLAGVPPRAAWGLALAAAAAVLYVVFRGQYTLPHDDEAPVFVAFNDLRAFIDANRNSNPVLVVFITGLRTLITVVIEASQAILQGLDLARPDGPRRRARVPGRRLADGGLPDRGLPLLRHPRPVGSRASTRLR